VAIETILRLWLGLKERWNSASIPGQIALVLLVFGTSTVLFWQLPLIRPFVAQFWQSNVAAQEFILSLTLMLALGLLAYGVMSAKAKEDERALRRMAEAEAEAAREQARQLQERWDHLLEVECRDNLWRRPYSVAPPTFVPRLNRKTRFITMLNLKGGVGKTTLTANLAACLACGPRRLRVLLVDIDFQGTLSAATLAPNILQDCHRTDRIVNALLTSVDGSGALPYRLAVGMNGVEGAEVIAARDTLDTVEFQAQAQYFLNSEQDIRFRFRSHFHKPEVFERYDVVIFDSPPRVTASVVNAIAASDYVLIPTKLDQGSIDAVPRTVGWLRSLESVSSAEILGVVAMQVRVRLGRLVAADQVAYNRLREVVRSESGKDLLFSHFVRNDRLAIGQRGLVAGVREDGRAIFEPVAQELCERMSR